MHAQFSQLLYILQQCAARRSPRGTQQLHALSIKTGLYGWSPILNSLVHSYGRVGDQPHLHYARSVFDEMAHRDHVAWASVLTAYTHLKLPKTTLSLFTTMFSRDGLTPDAFVFACLVNACSGLCLVRLGKQVHARFVPSLFCNDDVVKSSLVDMYAKCGMPDAARVVFESIVTKSSVISWTAVVSAYAKASMETEALELFNKAPFRSLPLWTALISGLVQSGNGVSGVRLFIDMRREGVDVEDPLVLSSVVGASANLAALELGRQLHGLVILLGYCSCLFISNALVDVYAKCSDISSALGVFGGMTHRDVVSWTSVIVGFAQHGRAEEALDLYEQMVLAGVRPNEVTFVGLIYACSHAGLVSKGRELFKSMTMDHGIKPSLQHFTCLLDLYSRSGHLDEAENLITTMPFTPDEPTWAVLLSACKHHGNTEMGKRIADHLLSLNPKVPSTYILLSNFYAKAGMWERMSAVRRLMGAMDVKKDPGYSYIQFGKENQVFHAGETCHPMKEEIFAKLNELDGEMQKRGYVPDTSHVLHDMEEQEKERNLLSHSERLAVSYGLLKSRPGTILRIVKNLRVCGDCHTFFKLLSSIVHREIILRDATRYHHFKDGGCSCNDFW